MSDTDSAGAVNRYKYASVMEAQTSGAKIQKGDMHIMDGKQPEEDTEQFMDDDNQIVVVTWKRLKLIELPEPMGSREIQEYLNENFDEYLGDLVGDSDE